MKKNPLVTVITPTYNRGAFLKETILSVLNQDYPRIEHIILDGNSQDNTKEVVKEFKDKIVWDSHKNRGEQYAVNKGLRMAKGDIIGIINSDDPMLPGAIKEVVKTFSENPKIIGVYSDWIKIDENGKKLEKNILPEYSFLYMLKNYNMTPGPITFYRRDVVKKLKKRDEKFKYVSDFDFVLRAALIGDFKRIPKFLGTFRIHPGAATLKHRGFEMAMGHFRLLNKIYSSKKLPEEAKTVKKQAYFKAGEAARISRGDNLFTKFIVSLVCLYYSPIPYLRLFISYRLKRN